MKALLDILIPRIAGPETEFILHSLDGKQALMRKLPQRMKGYRHYDPGPKILILVDRDDDDCLKLKEDLERVATSTGFSTKSSTAPGSDFQVCNRIAVEEMESWLLGDEKAVRTAFPRVPPFASKSRFRDPDAVIGGTWEALEQVLQRSGYYPGGLAKIECATMVAPHMDPDRNRSTSFRHFVAGLRSLLSTCRRPR